MLSILLLTVLVQGLLGAEVCYPPCGCFTDDPPYDGRPLPDSPVNQRISWRLYTRVNPNIGTEISLTNTQVPSDFDPSKATKFLIHGWQDSPTTYATQIDIKDAYLQKFDVNVVVVDWSAGANDPNYLSSMGNTRVVGACSGQIAIQMGAPARNVHCSGHSLGGQTCGYMGEYLGGQMGRATGLDPAGPGFEANEPLLRIDTSDAQFVDIIHTNTDEYGMDDATGHVDFYPNKGAAQTGCATGFCAHMIVLDYYLASFDVESCQFTAYPCTGDAAVDAGQCETCIANTNCQRMGYYSDTMPGRGRFHLETNAAYPHCQT